MGQKESETIDVTYDGYYNGNTSFHWERSDSNVDCAWGSVSGKTCPLTLTAKAVGNTVVTVSMIDSDTKKELASTSISVHVDEKSYTISYDANGGTGVPPSQIKAHGSELTLSSVIPKRFGYNFLGWNTSPEASYAQYKPNDSFTKNVNTVLYAVWKSAPVITLDSESTLQNIGNVNIEIAGTTGYICITPRFTATYFLYSEGDSDTVGYLYDLDENQLESDDDGGDGLNFKIEYLLEKNAVYYLGVKLHNSSSSSENICIMAERKTCMVTFDSRGGTDIPAQVVQSNGKAVEPDVPLRAEYTFGGWYTDTECTVKYDFGTTVTEDLTLYAKWDKIAGQSIQLDKNILTLSVGETAMLKAEITPNSTISSAVTWMSNDTSVATVKNGLVTAVSEGLCTITASVGGKSAVCNVTVTQTSSKDDIASGTYKNIKWRIDNNGKLTVEGSGDFSDTNSVYGVPWSADRASIKSAEIKLKGVVNASYMFYECENLVSVDMRQFDTGNVTNMRAMFYNCHKLTNLDLSNFKTQNVTDMAYMFSGCNSLNKLDLKNFNAAAAADMKNMFQNCDALILLYTPYNVNVAVPAALPSGTWYDMEGQIYTELPKRTTDSILLGKSKKPIADDYITAVKVKTVYRCGDVVETDDISVTYYGSDGTVRQLKNAEYTTNISMIDTSTAGEKIIIVTYHKENKILTAEIPLTVTKREEAGDTEESSGTEESSSAEDSSVPDMDDSSYQDTERIDLKSVSGVIADIRSKVYDGNEYKPIVKVTITVDEKKVVLTEGADYRVSYKSNVNAGTGTVIVKGNGIYKGTLQKNFAISPKSMKQIRLVAGSIVGNATKNTVSAVVYMYDGAKRLTEGEDYVISEPKIVKTTAQVTVTGKGNYKDTVTAKVIIYEAGETLIRPKDVKLDKTSVPYTGKEIKSIKAAVTINGNILNPETDYKVQYKNNKNAGTAFVIVTGKGKYRGTVVVPFTITAETSALHVTVSKKSFVYNGKLQRPTVKVTTQKDGKTKKLSKNDYTVTYKNNFHAGTADVIVNGKGNYAGLSGTAVFKIERQQIKKASLRGMQNNLMLIYNKHKLKEGTDYETPIYGSTVKSKVEVTVIGKGDFTGQLKKKVKTG